MAKKSPQENKAITQLKRLAVTDEGLRQKLIDITNALELENRREKALELLQSIDTAISKGMVKGTKGDKGDMPARNEVEAYLRSIFESQKASFKGKDGYTPKYGVDYGTPEEKAEFILDILGLIEFDEKNTEQIAREMEKLPESKKLTYKAIKDAPDFSKMEFDASQVKGIEKLLPKRPPIFGGGSGATFLKSLRDVDLSNLTKNSEGKYVLGGGGGSVSDTAYGPSWDGVTDEAASKNAIYDKIETLAGGHDPVTVTDSAEIDFTLTGQDITAVLKAGSVDETKLDTSVNDSLNLADSAIQPGDTIDADTTTISNLEVDNFKGTTIVTEDEGIANNINDTTIPTSAAVSDYVSQAVNFAEDFYFNNTADAIGGIYYQMTDADLGEAGSTLVSSSLGTGDDQALFNFINAEALGVDKLQAGLYTIHMHAQKTGNKPARIYAELYTRTSGGTETLVGTSAPSILLTTSDQDAILEMQVADAAINTTDKLVVKFYANIGSSGTDVTITLNLENDFNSRILIPTTTEILNAKYLQQTNNLSDVENASTARDNLGLTIGTDVQAYDALLADIAGLTPTNKEIIQFDGTNYVSELSPNYKEVFNNTGSTIGEGTVVHITGSAGAVPLVTEADKDSDLEVSGVMIEDIAAGTTGIMQVQGTLSETFISTTGLTAGDPIYLGDNGAFTGSRPGTGNIIQIGVAGVIAPSNGSILLNCPATVLNNGVDIPVADGGTGASTAAGARTNLGAAPTASPTLTGTTTVDRLDYDQGVGTVSALGNLGATETIDWSTATHFSGNLDSNITFTNSNSVTGQSITLYLTYSGAQRTITWPTTTWLDNSDGSAPTAPAASGDVLVVTLQNIGGTIYGSATGNYAVYA